MRAEGLYLQSIEEAVEMEKETNYDDNPNSGDQCICESSNDTVRPLHVREVGIAQIEGNSQHHEQDWD